MSTQEILAQVARGSTLDAEVIPYDDKEDQEAFLKKLVEAVVSLANRAIEEKRYLILCYKNKVSEQDEEEERIPHRNFIRGPRIPEGSYGLAVGFSSSSPLDFSKIAGYSSLKSKSSKSLNEQEEQIFAKWISFRDEIFRRTYPPVFCQLRTESSEDGLYGVFEVPQVPMPVGTWEGKFLQRVAQTNGKIAIVPMFYPEMQSRQFVVGLYDYSGQILPEVNWDDLHPYEFQRLKEFLKINNRDLLKFEDKELALKLGLIDENENLRLAALLLFGKEQVIRRYIPTHEVMIQIGYESKDYLYGPLLEILQQCEEKFERSKLNEFWSFPLLREVILNALVHRDYLQSGAVEIKFQNNQLNVSNPGSFPLGIHLQNFLSAAPRPRNFELSYAIKKIFSFDRKIQGINFIFYEHLTKGLPLPVYDVKPDNRISVTLFADSQNFLISKIFKTFYGRSNQGTLQEMLVINYLINNDRSSLSEIAQAIHLSEFETERLLQQMTIQKLIDCDEIGFKKYYSIASPVWSVLDSEKRVRKVFDPSEKDKLRELILNHVKHNGRISRGEAAELCKIEPYYALRLLKELVDEKILVQKGDRRGTHYVFAA